FAIADLAIRGVAGFSDRVPTLFRRLPDTADAAVAARADALVILDRPDSAHRVARRVRRRAPEIPILDYVSPTVWAWRPWRARAVGALCRFVHSLFPFLSRGILL